MSHPFLITGMGRSGTQYLATHLNESEQWDVQHEPGLDGMMTDTPYRPSSFDMMRLRTRFAKQYYGEVNSHLRLVAKDLPVKVVVLARHPAQILRSIMFSEGWLRMHFEVALWTLKPHFDAVAALGEHNFVIHLEDLAEGILKDRVWEQLLDFLGIVDLDYTQLDTKTKIHTTQGVKDMPPTKEWTKREQALFRQALAPYRKTFGYDLFETFGQ